MLTGINCRIKNMVNKAMSKDYSKTNTKPKLKLYGIRLHGITHYGHVQNYRSTNAVFP